MPQEHGYLTVGGPAIAMSSPPLFPLLRREVISCRVHGEGQRVTQMMRDGPVRCERCVRAALEFTVARLLDDGPDGPLVEFAYLVEVDGEVQP